jgi:DNA gyrase subunit A
MGRNTRGVRGIRLGDDEEMVGMIAVDPDDEPCVLTVSANGYGKRTPLEKYRVQGRGGKGLITMNRTKRTGPLVTIKGVYEGNDLMVITENGIMIRTSVDDISTMGRNTQGVRVINLKKDDSIADVTRVVTEEDEEASTEEAAAQATTNGQAVEAE